MEQGSKEPSQSTNEALCDTDSLTQAADKCTDCLAGDSSKTSQEVMDVAELLKTLLSDSQRDKERYLNDIKECKKEISSVYASITSSVKEQLSYNNEKLIEVIKELKEKDENEQLNLLIDHHITIAECTCLELLGMRYRENEALFNDTFSILSVLCKDLNRDQIVACYRRFCNDDPGIDTVNQPPVIIKFTSQWPRDEIYRSRDRLTGFTLKPFHLSSAHGNKKLKTTPLLEGS